jgi:hypothetical protein
MSNEGILASNLAPWLPPSLLIALSNCNTNFNNACKPFIVHSLLEEKTSISVVKYNMVNNQKHGKSKEFINGRFFATCNYVDGKMHGEHKYWFENGQLAMTCDYINDKRHGSKKTWYENGQPKFVCNYINGILHGKSLNWHENGQLKIENEENPRVRKTLR